MFITLICTIVFVFFPFTNNQPDESFSDDFLFPMTSRLSYTSSPESDGEFCDPETPAASRTHLPAVGVGPNVNGSGSGSGSGPPSQDAVDGLTRSNSDSNLANKGERIPDYNVPPPYAVNTNKVNLTTVDIG